MKKFSKILSVVLCLSMLCVGFALGVSADDKTYEYELDMNKPANTYDLYDLYAGVWGEAVKGDGTGDEFFHVNAAKALEEMKSGSGYGSGDPGMGAGVDGYLRVYKNLLTRKYIVENAKVSGGFVAIKFNAPVKGNYTTNIAISNLEGVAANTNLFYFIGNESTGYVKVTAGGTTQGRHDFRDDNKTDGVWNFKMNFDLEKGDSIIICFNSWSKSKTVYTMDKISVSLKNAAEEPPVITEPAETTTNKEEATSPETTENTPVTTEAKKNNNDDNKLDPIIIIAAVAAVVVIVAVVVTVVVIKKKKK